MVTAAQYEALTRVIGAESWPHDPLRQRVFVRMMTTESDHFDPDVVECRRDSSSGARGIAQLIPRWHPNIDPCDPPAALHYAAAYLDLCEAHTGSLRAGVAGYNAGPGAVRLLIDTYRGDWESYLPDETVRYLAAAFAGEAEHEGGGVVDVAPIELAGLIDTIWSPNTAGPRPRTVGIVIHSTRSGQSLAAGWTLAREYQATINWFGQPASGVSTQFVVGPERVCRMVADGEMAQHAGEHNATHLGIEIVQPRDGDPYPDFCYRAAAAICRDWCAAYGIPVRHITTSTTTAGVDRWGLIGHQETDQGKRVGKTDPGRPWDWDRFIKLINGNVPPQPSPVDAATALRNLIGEAEARAAEIQALVSAWQTRLGEWQAQFGGGGGAS